MTDRAQTDAAATLLLGLACSFYDEILKSSLGPAESSLKKDAMLYNLKSDPTIFIQDWIFSEDTEGNQPRDCWPGLNNTRSSEIGPERELQFVFN